MSYANYRDYYKDNGSKGTWFGYVNSGSSWSQTVKNLVPQNLISDMSKYWGVSEKTALWRLTMISISYTNANENVKDPNKIKAGQKIYFPNLNYGNDTQKIVNDLYNISKTCGFGKLAEVKSNCDSPFQSNWYYKKPVQKVTRNQVQKKQQEYFGDLRDYKTKQEVPVVQDSIPVVTNITENRDTVPLAELPKLNLPQSIDSLQQKYIGLPAAILDTTDVTAEAPKIVQNFIDPECPPEKSFIVYQKVDGSYAITNNVLSVDYKSLVKSDLTKEEAEKLLKDMSK